MLLQLSLFRAPRLEAALEKRQAGRRGALGRGRATGGAEDGGRRKRRVRGSARLCGWEPPPAHFRVNGRQVRVAGWPGQPTGIQRLRPSTRALRWGQPTAGQSRAEAADRRGLKSGPREKEVPGRGCEPSAAFVLLALPGLLLLLWRIPCLSSAPERPRG